MRDYVAVVILAIGTAIGMALLAGWGAEDAPSSPEPSFAFEINGCDVYRHYEGTDVHFITVCSQTCEVP